MLSLRIERHGSQFTEDVMDDCQHAEFFFSNGYLASCYYNEEHMINKKKNECRLRNEKK